jgi:hypothetical protein
VSGEISLILLFGQVTMQGKNGKAKSKKG